MTKELHGQLKIDGQRFAIVVSRFNEFITSKLLAGAIDAFKRHGGDEDNVTCVYVPGSFELPFMAKRLAESGAYDAVVCLGCVIRGQTPHFEYIAETLPEDEVNVLASAAADPVSASDREPASESLMQRGYLTEVNGQLCPFSDEFTQFIRSFARRSL